MPSISKNTLGYKDAGYCIDIEYCTTMGYWYGIQWIGISPIWNAKPNSFSKLQIGGGEGSNIWNKLNLNSSRGEGG